MSVFIIAEAGVNHNGDLAKALKLVEIAAKAGADAIKFQTFKAAKLVTADAAKAAYQQQQTGEGSQYEMLRALELSESNFQTIAKHCLDHNIEFMSTGFDNEAIDFLVHLGIKRLKVPSGEITNISLLRHIAAQDLPIILSTGMATLDEVRTAVDIIKLTRSEKDLHRPLQEVLTILHCTSNYPAQMQDVNLAAMQTMARAFSVPVGYSDHTLGITIPIMAAALGATVIEKHFTLDKTLPGPDHSASLEPEALTQMVRALRDVELAFGDGVKAPRPSELAVKNLVRRSIVLNKNIKQGDTLTLDSLSLLRPGTGIAPKDITQVVGKVAKADIESGTLLDWEHLVAS